MKKPMMSLRLRLTRDLRLRGRAIVSAVHEKARLPPRAGNKKPAPIRWVQAIGASQVMGAAAVRVRSIDRHGKVVDIR